jgi:hypothetical protein
MTTQKSKFSRSVKGYLPSQLKSPTISKHKIMNDQTFPCHCEEPSSLVIARSAATKQSRGDPFVVARHDSAEAISAEGRGLPRSRLPARRRTSAGEPSLGLLALKLQRRQAGRSLAMTGLAMRENEKTKTG